MHAASVNRLPFLIQAAIVVSLAQPLFAQSDRVIQVTQISQSAESIPKHPPAVVEDLGDIRPLSSKGLLRRMRYAAGLRGEFVSNADSVGNHGNGDFLLLPSVGAAFEQPLGHGLSLEFNGRTEAFIYAKADQFSFWGFSGTVFATYQPDAAWPKLYAGIEPYWYSSTRTGDQLAKAMGISTGIMKEWSLNRDQTVAFAGYHFSSFASSPAIDDRNTHRGTVGVTHQITPSLYGQLYYSYQFSDYTTFARRDNRHLAGLNFTWQLTEHWSANAATYFVDNDSNVPFGSYQTFGIGLGAVFTF
jgi:hypothetical protein